MRVSIRTRQDARDEPRALPIEYHLNFRAVAPSNDEDRLHVRLSRTPQSANWQCRVNAAVAAFGDHQTELNHERLSIIRALHQKGLPCDQSVHSAATGMTQKVPPTPNRISDAGALEIEASRGAFGVVAKGLGKRFGAVVAVRDASFQLPTRGVVGLLGPNGAGKTTTIRMIAGVLVPDEGELLVAGLDARSAGRDIRGQIGYLPESAPLYPELTVREYLVFRARIAGVLRMRAAIDDAMHAADVANFADRCCGTLSKGMQQRVGLAATLLADPKVLILDEPSVGLDPQQAQSFRALLRTLGASRLVLLSSHILSEVEDVCTRLVVIARGQVLADTSMESFRARAIGGTRLLIESARPTDALAASILAQIAPTVVWRARALSDGWFETTFEMPAETNSAELAALVGSHMVARLVEHGVAVRKVFQEVPRLEDAFVQLIAQAGHGGCA